MNPADPELERLRAAVSVAEERFLRVRLEIADNGVARAAEAILEEAILAFNAHIAKKRKS